MQLMPSVNLKQKQSLVMTPQLQQAIKLLQMTNMDIATFLEEQVLDNPFVEVTSPDKSNDSDKSNASDTDSQENAHDTLSDVDDGLNGASDLSSSIENGAALGDDPTAHSDLENRFGSEGLDLGRSAGGANAAIDSDWDDLAGLVADRPASLREFILRQVDLSITDTRQRFIAYELTDALEPSGWIGRSVEDVADMCTCTIDDVEDVLAVLQTLEPEGVFARALAECLYIQAREQDILCDTMTLVLDNLDVLGRGDMQWLARKAKCDVSDIGDILMRIREFNPKPGEGFESNQFIASAPDVVVSKGKMGWIVDLNRSTLPSLVIDEDYGNKVAATSRGVKKDEAKNFAGEALGSARWLKRALEQRNSTTLKISGEIIRHQSEFLVHGLAALKPLALKDVAEAVGMHESTVSRVTSGLTISTPKGCFALKSFFSVSIATTDSGDGTAAAAVRNMIKEIVSGEISGKPLSDDAIAALVAKKGVKLARRTVAKYRDMLRIPSSSERRRQARLNLAS